MKNIKAARFLSQKYPPSSTNSNCYKVQHQLLANPIQKGFYLKEF